MEEMSTFPRPPTSSDVNGATGERFILNVGGIRHEIARATLLRQPGTRLGMLAKQVAESGPGDKQTPDRALCAQTREFYYDRHPGVFNAVMEYHRSGELHMPVDVCGAIVKRELEFWGISDTTFELCCVTNYISYLENKKNLAEFNATLSTDGAPLSSMNMSGWGKLQHDVWMILEYPRSSKIAMVYAVMSFVVVLVSIVAFCLETLPSMRAVNVIQMVNVSDMCGNMIAVDHPIELVSTNQCLEIIDWLCTAFFTFEVIVRFTFAPNKPRFFISPLNIIDMLALLPLYLQIILKLADPNNCIRSHHYIIEVIFILRVIRILRVFHLVKHYSALKVLFLVLKASLRELLMLAIFLGIAMLVFSTVSYYAERRVGPSDIGGQDWDIISGLWWSVITLTTVGYGDMFPITRLGRFTAIICAVSGVLLISLVVPVVSSHFSLFYKLSKTKKYTYKEKRVTMPQKC